MNLKKNSSRVILIGMMGSGKTTIGQILAERLCYSFIDTDQIIMENEEKTILQIFEIFGESYFRIKEQELISSIKQDRVVISTGGGLPCYLNNIDIINQLGTSFYLKTNMKILIDRLKNHNESTRPIIAKEDEKQTLIRLKELYQKRKTCYNQAHYIINVNQSIDKVVDRIIKEVNLINKF